MTLDKLIKSVLLVVVVATLSGCYKLKENFIMKGEWVVKSVKVDGGSTNFMGSILPDYNENNCEYKIYFGEDGVCAGQYYINDTLNYAVQGTWVLLDPSNLYIDMDQYVKGTFAFEEQSTTLVHMFAERNVVKFYNIGEVQMFIEAERR